MAAVHIRDIPSEEVLEVLKRRAQRHVRLADERTAVLTIWTDSYTRLDAKASESTAQPFLFRISSCIR